MSYAQKNFSEKLGESDLTIAQAGGFITAVANILGKFNIDLSPVAVADGIKSHGFEPSTYTNFAVVSLISKDLSIVSTGDGAPTSDNSIVQFRYLNKLTNTEAVTYAAVSSVEMKTIVDSYDGEVRSWDVYGGPVGFVTFSQTSADLPTPLIIPDPVNVPDTFTLLTPLKGYSTAAEAIAGTGVAVNFEAGTYYKIDDNGSAVKLAPTMNAEGYWINSDQNYTVEDEALETFDSEPVAPVTPPVERELPKTPPTGEEEDTKIKVKVIPPDPNKFKQSYVKYLNEVKYLVTTPTDVTDLEGKFSPRHVNEGEIKFIGHFFKDDVKYFRTKPSDEAGNWYGVPASSVKRFQSEDEFDEILANASDELQASKTGLTLHPRRAKMLEKVATTEGRLFSLFKKTKKD